MVFGADCTVRPFHKLREMEKKRSLDLVLFPAGLGAGRSWRPRNQQDDA
jgi:hypothetical protein